MLDEKERQVLLAGEVAEERPLGYVDGIGDLVHRRARVSLGLKQIESGIDEGLSSLALLASSTRLT